MKGLSKKIVIILIVSSMCFFSCRTFQLMLLEQAQQHTRTHSASADLDREVVDKLCAKLKDWNENGFPISDTSAIELTKANLKEWRFKYAKLYLVFDGEKAHPVIARMVLERIATEWYSTYTPNMKPRFVLEIRAFDDIESMDTEWGICKVKSDGSLETHWYPTDVY